MVIYHSILLYYTILHIKLNSLTSELFVANDYMKISMKTN